MLRVANQRLEWSQTTANGRLSVWPIKDTLSFPFSQATSQVLHLLMNPFAQFSRLCSRLAILYIGDIFRSS